MTGRVLALIAAAIVGVLVLCAGLSGALLVGGGPGATAACAGPPSATASDGSTAAPPVTLTPPAGGWPGIGNWTAEQVGNAATIITIGAHLNVPPRGWVIAIATAITESGLHNLGDQGAANDHDSLGLFQQRPSQGWGTPAQIMDPVHAATAFYTHLLRVPGWQSMPLADAAQAVQISAYPDAYSRHEAEAQQLVGAVGSSGSWATAIDLEHCLSNCPEILSNPGSADPLPSSSADIARCGWVAPVRAPILSGFRTAVRPGHDGVDLGAARGTPIRAASAGTVLVVRCNVVPTSFGCDRDGSPSTPGCGWYVDIVHADRVITRYCHLLTRAAMVEGQPVAAGQVIGVVGSSGNSSGPHLHFEVHVADRPVDPVAFMATRAPLGQP